MATTITPTYHEKLEWARCAQAMYRNDRNDAGHMLSGAAALRHNAAMDVERYNAVARIYQRWLAFNELPAAVNA